MSYIRTKDGRIVELSDRCDISYAYQMLNGINVGDTIKELCDACVVKLTYDEYPLVGSFYEFEHYIDRYVKKIPSSNPVTDIFAAIWTDKGLIYVAKLNEKGEWELLGDTLD